MNPSNLETHTSGLDVLIVYDSFPLRQTRKGALRPPGTTARSGLEADFSVWSLSALQLPTLAQSAASAAEHAALLIVAVKWR